MARRKRTDVEKMVAAELDSLASYHGNSWWDLSQSARLDRLMGRLFMVIVGNAGVCDSLQSSYINELHRAAADAIYNPD